MVEFTQSGGGQINMGMVIAPTQSVVYKTAWDSVGLDGGVAIKMDERAPLSCGGVRSRQQSMYIDR